MDTWTPLLISHTLAASIALPLGAYQLWRHPAATPSLSLIHI